MEPLAIITIIGGIALLVALFGGGIKAKEIEIPSIPGFLRILSGITGIILIGMALRLSYPNATSPPAIPATVSPAEVQSTGPAAQAAASPDIPITQPVEQSVAPTSQSVAQPITGDAVLDEDFEDGTADDFRFFTDDWLVVDDGAENKVLEVRSLGEPPSSWIQADFGPVTLGDYTLDYRVRLVEYDFAKGSYSGSTSLAFRQSSAGAYSFVINPYGHQVELNHVTSTGSWKPINDEQGLQPYDFQKNTWYSIRIEAYGTQIKVYVDGNAVFSVEDSRLSAGGFAFLRAPDTVVQFDDIRVTK